MNIQEACLNRYPSPQSRRRIGYELNRLAQLFQIASVNDIDWPTFTRATIGALLARPELTNRKAASQNFTLSVIKSLCEEACFQRLMPLEQYFAIERIPNFRGNSQHGSPCLSSDRYTSIASGVHQRRHSKRHQGCGHHRCWSWLRITQKRNLRTATV